MQSDGDTRERPDVVIQQAVDAGQGVHAPTSLSPASKVLAMWENDPDRVVPAPDGSDAGGARPAAEPAEPLAGGSGSWAPPVVKVTGKGKKKKNRAGDASEPTGAPAAASSRTQRGEGSGAAAGTAAPAVPGGHANGLEGSEGDATEGGASEGWAVAARAGA